MAVHRYWRLYCLLNQRPLDVYSLQEITASSTVGGANELIGSTVSASSTFSGWPASQAIDGNPNLGWASTTAAAGEWIKFDLGAGNEKDLSAEISVLARNDGFYNQTPTLAWWQWSDDNLAWTTALVHEHKGTLAPGSLTFTPALTGTRLDAFFKTVGNIGISGRALVATSYAAGGVRANRVPTAPFYFEATITTLTGTPQVGIAGPSWDNSTALGTGANTIGYQPSGAVRTNNATLQTIAAYVAGDRIGVAVDPAARLIWFRVNNGNWNNSGAANPATGVGGIDFSATTVNIGTATPAVSASITGTVWTTAFNTFTDAAPAGFAAVGPVVQQAIPSASQLAYYAPGLAGGAPNYTAHPQWISRRNFSPAGPITKVSGLCEEAGVPVAGRLVEVFDRVSGDRLDYTYSAVDGSWELVALGRPSVRIVGSDPTTYNSLVYDNVVPV